MKMLGLGMIMGAAAGAAAMFMKNKK